MNCGVSREKLFNHFIEGVKRDISKCVTFALAFMSPSEISEIVEKAISVVDDTPIDLNLD